MVWATPAFNDIGSQESTESLTSPTPSPSLLSFNDIGSQESTESL